jgi:membrane protein DedA with SNARE-associated domain
MFDLNPLILLASSSVTQRIADWAVSVMETLGGPGAAFLIALENLFPPLPSEVILPLAGFTASQGSLSLIGAIAWTTLGSLVGALILYQLGKWLGRDNIRNITKKLPLVKVSDIDKAEHWFTAHENQAVLIGRMIPVVRSLISIPAGIEKMPIKLFIIYTVIGSLIWNSVLIITGYILGEQWTIVEQYVGIFQYIVIAAVILYAAYFVITRLSKKQKRKDEDS